MSDFSSLRGLSYAQAAAGDPQSLRGLSYAQASGANSNVDQNLLAGAVVFGQLSQAYAQFHATRMAAYEAKSQASALNFRSKMLELDRRSAEQQAIGILEQGQSQIASLTQEGGQRRAEITAGNAYRGITSGVGSAAEVQASEKLVERMDVYNINLASVRAANAARTRGVAIGNESLFARVGARNLRRSARLAAPEANLFAGIAGSAISAYALSNYRSN